LRARYYDPTASQFITRDPAAATTRSPYGYSGDNPRNATDPSGLAWWSGAESWFHQNARAIADVAHNVAMVCGIASLVLLVTGAGAPLAGVAAVCSIGASLVAAAADADMVSHGDAGVSMGDVAWDLAGAVPDAGAALGSVRAAHYAQLATTAGRATALGKGGRGMCAAARAARASAANWSGLEDTANIGSFFTTTHDLGTAFNSFVGQS
jgi:uncharacterized protein RhaS with RHS repeats